MAKKPLKMFKVNNISEVRDVDALYCIKTATDTEFSIVVTDAFGAIVNLKDLQTPAGIQGIASDDGTIEVTGTTFKNLRLSTTLVDAINSALKPGDNISELVNDAGYLTSFTEIDPIFQASEASNFVSGDKANLDNQSGVNTGDETALSIQSKRPLKTVDNKSLEGTGNIEIDYNTVINKPTEFPPSTHTHTKSQITDFAHTHPISDVTGLPTVLNDLQLNKEDKSNKNIANGYAGLDSSGKINPIQLPALAITDTFVVASQAEQLALVAEVGDVAVRTDLNKSFILRVTGASTLANWQELLTSVSVDQTIIDGSTNAVSGNAVFDALATKAPISSVHSPVTLGTENGLSLSTQQLSLGLASSGTTGALSGTDWNTFNNKVNGTGTNNFLTKWSGTNTVNASGAWRETSNRLANATDNGSSDFQVTGQIDLKSKNTQGDGGQLGAELLTTGSSNASWTGTSFATGYTHATGSVTTLTSTLAPVINNLYQVAYTVTGRTAGSFTITFGGTTTSGITSTGAVGDKASTTGALVITPTSDFNGTIILSIKQITAGTASFVFRDNGGTIRSELRILANGNTANGVNALVNNTIGNGNIANGVNALRNNTTGNYNIANGVSALLNNTTGNYNIANGVSALLNNTIGNGNTANGASALVNNTTGNNNTANGVSALQNNTTGGGNIANGESALLNNTIGNGNIANGVSALRNNTTGNYNIANGESALRNNTTGNYNIANGESAGRFIANGTPLTVANNSTFLGANTKALSDNSTNETVIGHNAIGDGNNTVSIGNTSVVSSRLRGRILQGGVVDNLIDSGQFSGNVLATGFKTASGTASQFLKANGSVDSNTYLTSASLPTVDQTIIDGSTNAVSGNAVFDGLALKSNIGHTHVASQITDLSKASVGLGNVDNTSDLLKPISTATQIALNTKESAIASGTISQYLRGDKTWQSFPAQATVDQTIIDGSINAVSGNAVFDGLATKAPISSVHNPVTLGTANGLSLSTQQLSLGLASSGVTGALSGTDWNNFNSKFNTPTGLTTNYLPKWNGSEFVNSKIFDNNVGISFGGGTFFGGYEFLTSAFGNNTIYLGTTDGTQNPRAYISHQTISNQPQKVVLGSAFSAGQATASWYLENGRFIVGDLVDNLTDIGQFDGTISASPATTANQVVVKSQLDAKFNTPTGLTTNYLPKWNGSAFGNSQFFDNGTNVGIGTTTITDRLTVNGTISASPATTANQVVVKSQLDAFVPSGTVNLTGNQTISGIKTFSNAIIGTTANFSGTVTVPDPINPLNAATKQYVDAAARPYKVYTALLSQSNTDAPVAIVLENTIGNIVWTRLNTGQYLGTLTGAFTLDKTICFTGGNTNNANIHHTTQRNNDSSVVVETYNSGAKADYLLAKTSIEIRVYL